MLTETEWSIIYDAVEPVPVNILALTVGELLRIVTKQDYMQDYCERNADGIVEQARLAKGIIKAVEGLMATVKSWQPPLTAEQQQAAEGVKYPNFAESVLLECVDAYHLHSTAEAEGLPLADWYLVHKQRSAEARYNYNYNAIITRKHEQATKH